MPTETDNYRDGRDASVSTGFILPSHASDVRVVLLSDGLDIVRENTASAYAAGLFLREGRGLPLDEISVETSGEIYDLCVSRSCGKLGIILPKCKLLYSNKTVNVDGIELLVSAYSVKKRIYRICECEDVNGFSDASLRALLHSCGNECIDGACAFSRSDGGYTARLQPLTRGRGDLTYAALAVATRITHVRAAREIRLTLCGTSFNFSETQG